MNLRTLSMLPDDIGPLGPPIRREQTKPAPAPTVEHRPDGTLTTHPDGTMSFEPKVTPESPVPVFPFPTSPKEDPEPGAHGFMREPLKVGDRVRVRDDAQENRVGAVGVIEYVGAKGVTAAMSFGVPYGLLFDLEDVTWERVQ